MRNKREKIFNVTAAPGGDPDAAALLELAMNNDATRRSLNAAIVRLFMFGDVETALNPDAKISDADEQ